MKYHLTGEIRLHIEGQNRFETLPLWRTGDGTFYLPRKGEMIFQDGMPFEVIDLEWRYIGRDLASVVVHAGKPSKPPVKLCEKLYDYEEIVFDGTDRHYHQCILPDIPAEYKHLESRVEIHLCSCGTWWTVTH